MPSPANLSIYLADGCLWETGDATSLSINWEGVDRLRHFSGMSVAGGALPKRCLRLGKALLGVKKALLEGAMG